MKLRTWTILFAAFALVASACQQAASPTAAPAAGGERAGIKIEVVTHGQATDPFWSVVKNGVDAAAKDMGVSVNYSAPETFDMPKMAQLIDAAVAKKPDGLIVSLPDETALGSHIQAATDAGIPVITINSGSDVFSKYGAVAHIGQTEYEAGLGAGRRMAEAGVTKAICINQEVGNVALDLRCNGFKDGLGADKFKEVIAVNLADPTGAQQAVSATLSADPTIDGILTLGPTGSAPALKALQDLGKVGQIKLATFDLSKEVLEAIRDGNMLFAIDQQQFLQGYMPVVILTNFKLYGLMPGGGGVILTGPGFVTKDTAAQVIDLSAKGIR
jgi:simple sugar transport system substrate-binding protein